MTVNRTTLLDLPLPVTGTESGTWGDTTNNGLTQYLDIAIAGTLVLSTDADVTLTSTEGDSSATNIGATTAQYAILRWTATGSTTRNITALAQSKTYVVINATGGTQSIVLRGAGPTTGVTIISGEKAFCVWNGSDFVKVSSSAAAGGSNTQVQYNSSGVLAGSSNLTFDGTSLTLGGNPTLSAGTANGVLYLNGSKVATSGSALTFDGTNFGIGTSSPGDKLVAAGGIHSTGNPASLASGQSIFMAAYTTYGRIEARDWTGAAWLPIAIAPNGGNVGIGTSSPAAKLHVQGTYGYFADGTYNGYFGKGNGVVVGGGAADLGISTSTGAIVFGTGGSLTERMRLDSSGNLGLGVTPSAWSQGKAFEISAVGEGLWGNGLGDIWMMNGAYFNGGWKYSGTTRATAYRQGAGTTDGSHSWHIAASGTAGNAITFTQAMTLDASGNLGLGVTSMSAAFELKRGAGTGCLIEVAGNNNTPGTTSALYGQDAAGNAYAWNRANQNLYFGTNAAERARITSGGYFKASNSGSYVGSTGSYHEFVSNEGSATAAVYIRNTNASSPAGIDLSYSGASPNGTGNTFLYCQDSTALRTSIRSNGGLANYQSNNVDLSDARTKKDITPAPSYWNKIVALEIVTYKYNDQTHDDINVGVIAQQVESVEPVWVDADGFGKTPEDGVPLKTVYTKDITFAAIKALQEAMARIETLEAKVSALEGN